jgi:hypothetical protein
MSLPQHPKPAKLIVSAFMRRKELLGDTVGMMLEALGPIDMMSAWLPFDDTDYYEAEMGAPLFRRLVSFHELIDQTALVDIKLLTNEIEGRLSKGGKREVNLDPGYLLAERFVLATGKNYSHRIFLGKGIYADLTLIYQDGAFQRLEWTYPDYGGGKIQRFLRSVRDRYLFELRAGC